MSRNDMQFDRRSVLKTIGSAAVTGIGLSATSGNVAAIETKRRITRAYSDERRLRTAFEQHGETLRQTLVDAGFVAEDFEFGTLDFDVDPNVNGLDPTADDRLAGVTALSKEGTTTAFASVSTSSETHDLALFVQPERDKAYALVEPKASDDRFLVTESGVGTSSCFYSECTSECCAEYTTIEETYECKLDSDGNCVDCVVSDTSCECDTCECSNDGTCT